MSPPSLRLAPGREAPFVGGHPWVFSGSLLAPEGEISDGTEVRILTDDGRFVARGLYNSRSQIRVRLYRWEDASVDDAFFRSLLERAVALRRDVLRLDDPAGGARMVFSEGDGISGLTVDRYGPYLAVQFTSLALHERADALLDGLEDLLKPAGIVLRTEKGILDEEGLELRDGVVRGDVPEAPFTLVESGLQVSVNLRTGHKTGFYLDQRENRRRAAAFAAGRTVADVCCYTGGFSLAAAAAGAASVVGVDASAGALEMAEANAGLNGLGDRTTFQRSDAFKWLEAEVEAARTYGMIILDPPRFARSRKGVPSALKAYERMNALAVQCLEPGGMLVTFSCSGRVSADEFLGAVGRAAGATGRTVQVLERLGQPGDHPVSVTCPETAYLKGLVCRVG